LKRADVPVHLVHSCCCMLLLVTSLQSSLCSASQGMLGRVKELNLGAPVIASCVLLVSSSICMMQACFQLRSSIQTQQGTDRLHSSGVSPRFTRQGLRLGTTESLLLASVTLLTLC